MLVRTLNYHALGALAMSHRLFECFWCSKNAQGQTPLDLARDALGMPELSTTEKFQATLIHRMLTVAQEEWKAGMAPLVLQQLTCAVGVLIWRDWSSNTSMDQARSSNRLR